MNGACHDGAASTLGSAPILSVLVAAPTQENEMSRSLRGLALPAAALLALALGAVSPAVADTPSDASSPEPSTYTTPATPPRVRQTICLTIKKSEQALMPDLG